MIVDDFIGRVKTAVRTWPEVARVDFRLEPPHDPLETLPNVFIEFLLIDDLKTGCRCTPVGLREFAKHPDTFIDLVKWFAESNTRYA